MRNVRPQPPPPQSGHILSAASQGELSRLPTYLQVCALYHHARVFHPSISLSKISSSPATTFSGGNLKFNKQTHTPLHGGDIYNPASFSFPFLSFAKPRTPLSRTVCNNTVVIYNTAKPPPLLLTVFPQSLAFLPIDDQCRGQDRTGPLT